MFPIFCFFGFLLLRFFLKSSTFPEFLWLRLQVAFNAQGKGDASEFHGEVEKCWDEHGWMDTAR